MTAGASGVLATIIAKIVAARIQHTQAHRCGFGLIIFVNIQQCGALSNKKDDAASSEKMSTPWKICSHGRLKHQNWQI
jgi:hypothetical protein